MLSHPFYHAWTCGTLTKETLKEYAKEYYHHVKAFPTYISALHSRCENPDIRKHLLDNLVDEEGSSPTHPDLWRQFAFALGVNAEELSNHKPHPATQELITCFRENCTSKPLSVGIASLYSYESQIPAICQTKIEGLKKWYGMKDPIGYQYFSVHETADIEHSGVERTLLQKIVHTDNRDALLQETEKVLNALWNFLSSFLLN